MSDIWNPKHPLGTELKLRFDGEIEGVKTTIFKPVYVLGHFLQHNGEQLILHYTLCETPTRYSSKDRIYDFTESELTAKIESQSKP